MANKFLNGIDTTSLSVNSQYSLPTSDGSNGQVLKTDGSGNVTFSDGADSGFVFYTVKNSTGSTIAKGTGVYASGTDGNSGHILISPMVADGTIEPKYFIGITKTAITNGSIGQVVHFGEIDQINTSTYTDGDVLWCDPANDGGFTATEPAGPNLKLAVAIVINASTNGKIRVRVQGNEGLHELHDVNISSEANGDLLQWNATSGVWENKTLASIADARYVNVSGDTMTGTLKIYGSANQPSDNTLLSQSGLAIANNDGALDLLSFDDNTTVSNTIGFSRYSAVDGSLIHKFGISTWANTGSQGSNTGNRIAIHYGTDKNVFDSTELFSLKTNGYLGLNEPNAQARLHIVGDGWEDNITGSNLLRLESTDNVGAGITFKNNTGSYWSLYNADTSAWVGEGALNFVWSDGTTAAGAPLMTLNKTGNLGIGVGDAAPSKRLHVKTNTNEGILLEGTTSGVWMDIKSSTSKTWSIGALGVGGFGIYDRDLGKYRLTIQNSGRSYFNTGGDDYILGLYRDDVAQWWFKTYASGDFAIHENGIGDRLYIKDGKVGLVSSDPQERLWVNGNIGIVTNPTDSANSTWYSLDENHNTVNVVNGTDLYFKKNLASNTYSCYVYNPEIVGLNFDISFKLTLSQDSGYRHFAIAIASDNSNTYENFDNIILRDNIDNAAQRQVRIDVAGTSENSLVSSSLPSFADGTERHIHIQVRDKIYIVEVDGVVVHSFIASARTSSRGRVGFAIYESSETDSFARIRQFAITQYAHDRQVMPDIKIGGNSDGSSNYGVFLQNNKWYATQYSPSYDVVRFNANTVGHLDIYNQTANGHTGLNVGQIDILDSNASDGTLKMGGTTVINASRQGTFLDLKVESGSSNSIRIGDGFGSGGSATIHNYQKPLYLQYNSGVASGSDAEVRIGGGGTVSDLNLIGGGSISLTGQILMNRNGIAGDSIVIDHVEDSDWPFVFRTSTTGNLNDSGFWVNNDGTPDMRLRATDATISAIIHSNGDSYLNGGGLAIGQTSVDTGYKLAVNGSVIAGASSGNNSIVVSTSDANGALNAIEGVGLEIASDSSNKRINFRTGTTTRASILDQTTNTLTVNGSGYFDGVRLGRDFSITDRATLRLDSNGTGAPADVLFGHTATADETSWTGVYWSLSSRGSSAGNKFHFYRGSGQPSPYNSEAIVMTFHPSLQVDVNGDLYFGKGSDPRIYANTGVGLNIDGQALYLNRYTSANVSIADGGGNVGINTNSPIAKMHISSNDNLPATGSVMDDTKLVVSGTDGNMDLMSTDDNSTVANNIGFGRYNVDTGNLIHKFGIVHWANVGSQGSNTGNRIAFTYGTNKNTWSNNDLFTILSSGQVGIGKTSGFSSGGFGNPRLVIKQSESSNWGGINIEAAGNDAMFSFSTSDDAHFISGSYRSTAGYKPIYVQTGGATRLQVGNDGLVAVGSQAAQTKLDVDGSLLLRTFFKGNENGIFFRAGFATTNKYNVSIMSYDHNGDGSTPDGLTLAGYDSISFCTGSNTRNEAMRVSLGGNVRIASGGGNAANKLEVYGELGSNADVGILRQTGTGQFMIAEYLGGSSPVPFCIRATNTSADTSFSYGIMHFDRNGSGVGGSAILYFRRQDDANNWREYAGVGSTIASNGSTSYSGNLDFFVSNNGSARLNYMRLESSGSLKVEGDVVAYSTTVPSDARLKDDVKTIDSALDKVLNLRGVEFVWNKGKKKGIKDVGLIAQEVEKVIPEIVKSQSLPLMDGKNDDTEYKTVQYDKMVGVLIEAIKDQQKQIDELKAMINGSA